MTPSPERPVVTEEMVAAAIEFAEAWLAWDRAENPDAPDMSDDEWITMSYRHYAARTALREHWNAKEGETK